MPADMERFAQRITELRGSMTKASLARRAGISAAYVTTIEKGKAGSVSVGNVRGLADALNASRAELLELAGHEDDAIYDRMDEMKAAAAQATKPDPATLTPAEFVRKLRQLLALLEDSDEQPDDRGEPRERWLQPVEAGTPRTGSLDTEGTG